MIPKFGTVPNLSRAKIVTVTGLLASALLVGQTTTSTILGDVTDSQNAVVNDATVTVKSVSTGALREVKTGDTGSYRVYPLNPGAYEVTIAKSGFRSQTVKVTIEVAQTA